MVSNLLDEYVLNVLKNSGWSDGRKQDITQWIQILTEEGYIVNEYAKSILSELGDLQVRVSSDKNHLGVTMHFNPVNAASGEYDRMEIFNQASNEELFPIGECYDWVIYVSDSKKDYSVFGQSFHEFKQDEVRHRVFYDRTYDTEYPDVKRYDGMQGGANIYYKYEYDGNLGAIQYQYDNELHEIFPMVDSYY